MLQVFSLSSLLLDITSNDSSIKIPNKYILFNSKSNDSPIKIPNKYILFNSKASPIEYTYLFKSLDPHNFINTLTLYGSFKEDIGLRQSFNFSIFVNIPSILICLYSSTNLNLESNMCFDSFKIAY